MQANPLRPIPQGPPQQQQQEGPPQQSQTIESVRPPEVSPSPEQSQTTDSVRPPLEGAPQQSQTTDSVSPSPEQSQTTESVRPPEVSPSPEQSQTTDSVRPPEVSPSPEASQTTESVRPPEVSPSPEQSQTTESVRPPEVSPSPEQSSEATPPEETEEEKEAKKIQEITKKEQILRSKILNNPKQCKKEKSTTTKQIYYEKVQLKSELTDAEEEISQLLIQNKQLHPFLYFQPVIKTTPLSIGSITSQNLTECEGKEMEDIVDATPETKIIESQYKALEKQSLDQYLEQNQRNILQLLVASHIQLLESVRSLQAVNVIHFNISPDTVLYDTINATPVITDFRMAFTTQTLDDPAKSDALFPEYNNPFWPKEVAAIAYLIDSKEPKTTEKDVSKYPGFLQPNIPIKEALEELKKTHNQWDVFSVNKLIFDLLDKHLSNNRSVPFLKSYKKLQKELDIEVLLAKIDEIFQAVPEEEYKLFMTSSMNSRDEGSPPESPETASPDIASPEKESPNVSRA